MRPSRGLGEVWPKTREQRCWVHKTANVLAKLPKSQQPDDAGGLSQVARAARRCREVSVPVHPHMLGDATGYKLANDGRDTRVLQHDLGHKNR